MNYSDNFATIVNKNVYNTRNVRVFACADAGGMYICIYEHHEQCVMCPEEIEALR